MFDYTKAEITAGAFVLLALALLGYLSISIGGFALMPKERYRVTARFSNVGDLKPGAPVKLAGVTVGEVDDIRLASYVGEVDLVIAREVKLPSDSMASIATSGLLGDAYVSLSPGAADRDLQDGQRITRTEPALNLADLLGRYAFGAASEPVEPGAVRERAAAIDGDRSSGTAPGPPPAPALPRPAPDPEEIDP